MVECVEEQRSLIKTPVCEWHEEDGIIMSKYLKGVVLNLEDTKEMVRMRLEKQTKVMPIFNDPTAMKSIEKEARDYLANEGSEGLSAVAILVTNSVAYMAFNFYVKLSKPKVPTKFFTDKDEAIAWLKTFV